MTTSRDDDAIINAVADRIDQLGLREAAVLLLEAHRPLGLLGAQVLTLLQPIFGVSNLTVGRVIEVLEVPDFVDRLIERLENGDVERWKRSA